MNKCKKSLTKTELKLIDAGNQMKIALKHAEDEEIFRSCINSFIALARSVTFVMQKESAYNKELTSWYKTQMQKLEQLPIMQFFHEKRTYTIHLGHIEPIHHSIQIKSIIIDGREEPACGGVLTYWLFDDAKNSIPTSNGNVLQLCEEYFLILKNLVRNWAIQKTIWDNPDWLNKDIFKKRSQ